MDSTQSTEDKRGKVGGGSIWIWLAVLLLIHPLSLGPVAYLSGRGLVGRETTMLLYFPEFWLITKTGPRWPGMTQWYTQYVESCAQSGIRHASP